MDKVYTVNGYWNDDPNDIFRGYLMYDGIIEECPIEDDEIFYYGHPSEEGLEFTITSW